ncbi:MAG: EF-hand domain-containing protein [Akkermansiaceae bacterium]|jgi:hypothetical protein|nr:EF-hand domain-containing protein [Akkermansiaceae bacterium]MBJ7284446.1 EF-hand domain-containing protein [Akkermansiaceae bacterium]MBJ7395153.1 EF-hand domain-containing protein [Akkermansiaceae bacterium]MBJ7423416.1 EF-hand domain-containing protein [Akkermansiaceae bacterium]
MKFFNAFLIFGWVSCADRVGPVTPQTPVERQMLGLLEKFDRWDDNGDGELDAEEINEGIQSLKGKPQQVSYTAPQVIKFYDTDHSGTISLREAQDGYRRASEVGEHL